MASGPRLSLVTYNIWGVNTPAAYWDRRAIVRGAMPGSAGLRITDPGEVWRRRRALLAAELARVRPDVVVLQEANRAPGTAELQAGQVAADLAGLGHGYRHVQGDGGLAVVSRFPLGQLREHPLDVAGRGGHRGVLEVTVAAPGADIAVLAVHWPVGPEDVKVECARQTLRLCESRDGRPVVLCGDFNADSGTAPIHQLLGDGWLSDCWPAEDQDGKALTAPLPGPTWRLDHIFTGPAGTCQVAASPEMLGSVPDENGLFPSDHCGISAVLDFAG